MPMDMDWGPREGSGYRGISTPITQIITTTTTTTTTTTPTMVLVVIVEVIPERPQGSVSGGRDGARRSLNLSGSLGH